MEKIIIDLLNTDLLGTNPDFKHQRTSEHIRFFCEKPLSQPFQYKGSFGIVSNTGSNSESITSTLL